LFAGTTFEGERQAAAEAIKRIREKLCEVQESEPPVEYKFTMPDIWSRRLFVALLRRYGVKPYRYHGQRYTTVMARVPAAFVRSTLWPEFEQLDNTLREYLDDVTNRVIHEGICADSSEAEVRSKSSETRRLMGK
jgi:hypothetical protein